MIFGYENCGLRDNFFEFLRFLTGKKNLVRQTFSILLESICNLDSQ